MTSRNTYVDIARAVGTVGLGLTAGAMAGQSLFAYPMLRSLASNERLHAWNVLFEVSAGVFQLVITPTALLFASAAVLAQPGSGTVSGNRRTILGAVAASVAFVPAWTRLYMWSNIQWTRKALYAPGRQTDAAIARWERQHRVRATVVVLGFVAAVVELFSSAPSISAHTFNIRFNTSLS
ncbi:hypothetical protein BKA62DRAFT_832693 [Auriculariales sp. MPI-PUGE-AT-0066]|nr:hypothetical protein BKA62DRAFT_832693 [Auriculariales sp. MPI-PUGE-AT-0066]